MEEEITSAPKPTRKWCEENINPLLWIHLNLYARMKGYRFDQNSGLKKFGYNIRDILYRPRKLDLHSKNDFPYALSL